MYSHVPVSTSGSRSFAQPGIDARREARHAAVGARVFERLAHRRVDVRRVDQRRRPSSTRRSCPTAGCAPCRRSPPSGAGRRSRCSRRSRRRARAARRRRWSRARPSARARTTPPRPCPALSARVHPQPDELEVGMARRCSAARAVPTLPVLHWITRYVMTTSPGGARRPRSSRRGGAR